MPSTFFGLTIAGSGLSAFQAAINTTANNISNVRTDGYSRQTANRVASEALRVHQKYGTAGSGVTTESITQMRDFYYDVKYWENNASLGYYDRKQYYMKQIETYFIDDDKNYQKGFSTILDTMFSDLDTLHGNSGDINTRKQFIGSAQSLTGYFTEVSKELQDLQSSCNVEIQTTVGKMNNLASKIATLNRQIDQLEVKGGKANELRDQRALLIDELSQIVPVEVTEAPIKDTNNAERVTGLNYYRVMVGGQAIVDGYDYKTLECVPREYRANQADVEGLYDLRWTDTGMRFEVSSPSMTGQLKALFEMRDGNNEENFQGTVKSIDSANKTITIDDSNITSVFNMNMPSEGVITLGYREFTYDGFSYTTEIADDGTEKITSYTFNLKEDPAQSGVQAGTSARIGTSIDALGVSYYLNQMTTFVRSFSYKFNNIELQGVDLNGDPMRTFFVANTADGEKGLNDVDTAAGKTYKITTDNTTADTYYWLTSSTFAVAEECQRDPQRFATIEKTPDPNPAGGINQGIDQQDITEELLKLKSEVKLFRGRGSSDFLKCILSDISVDKQEADVFQKNYSNIEQMIEAQRLSISGVDEDEEALDLVKFQNAYNLASQMVQVMTEMYDQLILQTGV
ncbi:MAG: flagellar hook-associated protein FlgK [Lachnospiraceae bacterium]|nr:flagellar hook-associated protein FlgK [Lachnospiraceae bacterium]